MPKRTKTKWTAWTVPPVIAPIPPEGLVRPGEKREPVPWPLGQPLKETAEQLVRMMNTHPKLDPPDPAQRWALMQYAEYGALPLLDEWPSSHWREEAKAALDGFRFYWDSQPVVGSTGRISDVAKLAWGYFGPGVGPDKLKGGAYWWLALAVLRRSAFSWKVSA